MANLWNSKPSKLGFQFSKETIENLLYEKIKIHHKNCRKFRVGGVAKTDKDLISNTPRDKWICDERCINKE